MLAAYEQSPPQPIQWLQQVTWGELAARYGDAEGDAVFWLNDLPANKWAAAFLRERSEFVEL